MARNDPQEYLADDPEWQRIRHKKGLDRIEAHVARLNNNQFVRDSNRLYFVNSREKTDGTIEHFVDRSA